MREGQRVAYAGEDSLRIGLGSRGKILSSGGSSAHVMWYEGTSAGQVSLVDMDDLVPDRQGRYKTSSLDPHGDSMADQFDNSLSEPINAHQAGMEVLAVRETYDSYGEDGLLNALAEAGHIAPLTHYAEEALAYVATCLRHDPGLGEVLAQLDEGEKESLLVRVASGLLSGAIEEE